MGGYRPHFEGIPDEYYPLSACEVFMYTIFVIGIIGGVLGIMIGFIYWVTNLGLTNYIIAWSIIWLFFILLAIIAFYVSGKGRIREEKRLIVEQQEKQEKMKSKANQKTTRIED
jgi:cbb3-type cytochrome oxidase subunit 3